MILIYPYLLLLILKFFFGFRARMSKKEILEEEHLTSTGIKSFLITPVVTSTVAAHLKTFILTSVDMLLVLSLLGADKC